MKKGESICYYTGTQVGNELLYGWRQPVTKLAWPITHVNYVYGHRFISQSVKHTSSASLHLTCSNNHEFHA